MIEVRIFHRLDFPHGGRESKGRRFFHAERRI
jgi:hypothetical protein